MLQKNPQVGILALKPSSQKRVTGSIATISKQAETLFYFFFSKRQAKIVKTISAHSKSMFSFLGT
jgi:hypothetical protein